MQILRSNWGNDPLNKKITYKPQQNFNYNLILYLLLPMNVFNKQVTLLHITFSPGKKVLTFCLFATSIVSK